MKLAYLPNSIFCTLLICLCFSLAPKAQADNPLSLIHQRLVFKQAYQQASRGQDEFTQHPLQSYVLYPDLRAAYLMHGINHQTPTPELGIQHFLEKYPNLIPSQQIRQAWGNILISDQRWHEYLTLHEQAFTQTPSTQQRCQAALAELNLGQIDSWTTELDELWLTTKSRPARCDPLFKQLKLRGLLNRQRIEQRYELALDANKLSLAAFLAKDLSASKQRQINRWQQARQNPERFLKQALRKKVDREQTRYALNRLASRKFDQAWAYWQQLDGQSRFSATQRHAILKDFALRAARRHREDASDLLQASKHIGEDTDVTVWAIRHAIWQQHWPDVLNTIDQLPTEAQTELGWQYWHARAHQGLGNDDLARTQLQSLASQRDYYGFLAADRLGLPYQMQQQPVAVNPEIQASLLKRESIQRAREWFHVGHPSKARREWNAAFAELSETEKPQAALLAHRWGWDSRAIYSLGKIAQFDDLDVRYPTPFRGLFSQHANQTGLPTSWLYGISRSESLFMPDIKSHAGAIGLMQLMPATAKATAKKMGAPYRSSYDLTQPALNIELGSAYLNQVYRQLGHNPVMATAAYNAGPHRVKQWLPKQAPVAADIWIENIAFNETRKYVRKVLASHVTFAFLMNPAASKANKLIHMMPPIPTTL